MGKGKQPRLWQAVSHHTSNNSLNFDIYASGMARTDRIAEILTMYYRLTLTTDCQLNIQTVSYLTGDVSYHPSVGCQLRTSSVSQLWFSVCRKKTNGKARVSSRINVVPLKGLLNLNWSCLARNNSLDGTLIMASATAPWYLNMKTRVYPIYSEMSVSTI